MPYIIHEEDGKYHVRKEGSEHNLGTHESREDAESQISAIEANETHEDPKPTAPDHTDTIHAISERLSTLENVVQGLIPQNRDETPVKRPWTHKRF